MKKIPYFIIDFDSTFVTIEALDELAKLVLATSPRKDAIVSKIESITRLGMDGQLPFHKSLSSRLKLIKANKKDIDMLVSLIKDKITPSIKRNKDFIKRYSDRIYILSGGFHDYIEPIVKAYGIQSDHILANSFTYDSKGAITGFDSSNPLSKAGGKVTCIKQLQLKGPVYMIGDGYTDYQLLEHGCVDGFYAFTENVKRTKVTKQSKTITADFDDVLFRHHLPRSRSYPKSRMKVLLLKNVHSSVAKLFKKAGYSVEHTSKILSEQEIKGKIKDISILGVCTETNITPSIIKSAHRLLAIGGFCSRISQIDIDSCSDSGIAVFDTPYVTATNTTETDKLIADFIFGCINRYIDNGDTVMSTNMPSIQLPKLQHSHRFLHIHRNVPGVLAEINAIFAQNAINIEGQYLRTNDKIGYVTSGTISPTFNKGIGLAFVKKEESFEENEINIKIREKPYKAKIVKRPIYAFHGKSGG